MATILCYPKCTTCQKTLKWLDENGITYTYRDISTQNPTQEELAKWYKQSGLPLKKFFNTSGLVYKNERIKDKLPAMTEDEQLALLATNGMLVKRPIFISGDTVLVGFKEAEWESVLRP